jgi:hypothetical protein
MELCEFRNCPRRYPGAQQDRCRVGCVAILRKQRANRLKVLIRFARFAQAEDSGHQIPPDNIFCGRLNRRTPYIFTDEEVKQLILHATRLWSTRLIAAAYLQHALWPTRLDGDENL